MSISTLNYKKVLAKFNNYEEYLYDISDIHCWEYAKEDKRKIAFLEYTINYPNGRYIIDAKEKLKSIEDYEAWKEALETNTINNYKEYLKKYPKGSYTDKAKNKIKQIEESNFWDKTTTKDTIKAYEDYLQKYPNGKYKTKAKKRIFEFKDEKAWQKAYRYDSINTYTAYIDEFPNGKYISKAKAKLEELKQDKNAWEEAKNNNNISFYEKYINNYPNGKFIDTAYKMIKKLKQDALVKQHEEIKESAIKDFIYLEEKQEDIFEKFSVNIAFVMGIVFSATFNQTDINFLGMILIYIFTSIFFTLFVIIAVATINMTLFNDIELEKYFLSKSKNTIDEHKKYNTIITYISDASTIAETYLIINIVKDSKEEKYGYNIVKVQDIIDNNQKIKNAISDLNNFKKRILGTTLIVGLISAIIVHLTFGKEVSFFFN